jgi:hypothetical protein
MKELSKMWNRYQPYRGGIRFFPHIFPIAFPLIFPFGIGLAAWLFHLLMPLIGLLLLVALVFFIIRTITLGSPGAAWNSMRSTGSQWQQRFTSQNQQAPYYRPSASAGQEQASQQYGQGYTPEQPYYRPSSPAGQEQPRTQYPEQMPPMQQ